MAGELQTLGPSGGVVYAVIRNAAGQAWNTAASAFENFIDANQFAYAVVLAEQGASGYHVGDFPAAMAAGRYAVVTHHRTGATPAVSDEKLSAGNLEWSGGGIVTLASRSSHAAADVAALVLVTPENKIDSAAGGIVKSNIVQVNGATANLVGAAGIVQFEDTEARS